MIVTLISLPLSLPPSLPPSQSEGSITSLSDNEEEEEDDNDTSSTSSASDSASSSSSSSSEDSSLDSTNEDLFQSHHRLVPVEHYHFPPQNLSNRPHPLAEKPPLLDERPHPLSSYRKSMSTSTSSVPKKSTPPVGSTHLPHPPHPHAPQPRRHRNKVDGGGRGGGKRKRLSKKQNPLQLQHQLGGVGGVGASGLGQHPLIDHSSLNKLFGKFCFNIFCEKLLYMYCNVLHIISFLNFFSSLSLRLFQRTE